MLRPIVLLALCASALAPLPALAGNSCKVGFQPETSGFPLNPILDKLTVKSAEPGKPGDTCVLEVGDEILKVNEQPVQGARGLKVMRYWKSLKDGATITFVVKRDGAIVTLVDH
jgi:S1-C subfamily serine protease